MTTTPQIIVSLTPSGALKVELPGFQATRRSIELAPGEAEHTLKRILLAQQAGEAEIGLDGAPTSAQVRHWERHSQWPQSGCRFCMAEGRAGPGGQSRQSRREIISESAGVKVTRVREKAKGAPRGNITCSKLAEDLGL